MLLYVIHSGEGSNRPFYTDMSLYWKHESMFETKIFFAEKNCPAL